MAIIMRQEVKKKPASQKNTSTTTSLPASGAPKPDHCVIFKGNVNITLYAPDFIFRRYIRPEKLTRDNRSSFFSSVISYKMLLQEPYLQHFIFLVTYE